MSDSIEVMVPNYDRGTFEKMKIKPEDMKPGAMIWIDPVVLCEKCDGSAPTYKYPWYLIMVFIVGAILVIWSL